MSEKIPTRDALNILSLHVFFGEKISKKELLEIWKKNREKKYEQLKEIILQELEGKI
jgi:hypothetical protein